MTYEHIALPEKGTEEDFRRALNEQLTEIEREIRELQQLVEKLIEGG